MDLDRADSHKVIEYVKQETAKGNLRLNDRIGTALDLALQLGIDEQDAQRGLEQLELLGIAFSRPGIGYVMTDNIHETMGDMLSFVYFLEGVNESQVAEYRWMLERTAIAMAVDRISQQEKMVLLLLLQNLEATQVEEEQIYYDKMLHLTIVRASRNDFIIASYEALTSLMDNQVELMRTRIVRGMKTRNTLEAAHAQMVRGILDGDKEMALQGIRDHIGYVNQYGEVETRVEER